MKIALLIASQRTGTNYLRALLDGHPDLRGDLGEVFLETGEARARPTNFWTCLLRRCIECPEAWLPMNRQRVMNEYLQFIGEDSHGRTSILDIKYNSLHHGNPSWVGLLDTPPLIVQAAALGLPVIHLRRRNALRVVVSRLRADHARRYSLEPGQANPTRAATVNPAAVLAEIEYLLREAERVSQLLNRHCQPLEIEYAQLWRDTPGGTRNHDIEDALQRHCGVEPILLPNPPLVKMTPHNLGDAVANWQELKAAVLQSPHAWMIQEKDTNPAPNAG